jgi:hypothetical protein
MNERFQGKNIAGKYEGTLRNLKDHQMQVIQRNNIIESMYRAGYSKHQIANHLSGKQSLADQTADYSSRQYYKDEHGDRLPQEFLTSFYGGTGNGGSASPPNKDTMTANRQGMLSSIGDMRQKIFEQLAGKFGNR